MKFTREIPEKGSYDVIVCGGGVAGVAAALQAARLGNKKILLIEKSIKLGGLATLGLVNYWVPLCNGRGRQVIFGMADEFFKMSIEHGFDSVPEDWQDPNSETRLNTVFDPELFALELTKMLNDAGIEMMFDSIITDAVYENGTCKGVVIENKSGAAYYTAKIFIEATGDCDLLRRIGIPTLKRGNYHTYLGRYVTLKTCEKAVEKQDIRHAVLTCMGGKASLYGDNHPENIPLYDGTSADEVNRYLISNQVEMLEHYINDDRKSRQIVTLPGMVQFRTTACLDADYVVKDGDEYKHFEDSVCAISDMDRMDYLYEIPYRAMIRSDVKNIIVAGRCVAGEGYAWDVIRVIPPAILTGQAAMFAALQAIDEQVDVKDINIEKLQKSIADANILIHFEDEWVPEVSDGRHLNNEANHE